MLTIIRTKTLRDLRRAATESTLAEQAEAARSARLSRELGQATRQAASLQRALDEQQNHSAELSRELEKSTQWAESLQRSLREQQNHSAELSRELTEARNDLDTISKSAGLLHAQLDEANKEYDELDTLSRTRSQRLAEVESNNAELHRRLSAVEAERDEARRIAGNWQADWDKICEELHDVREEHAKQTKLLADMERTKKSNDERAEQRLRDAQNALLAARNDLAAVREHRERLRTALHLARGALSREHDRIATVLDGAQPRCSQPELDSKQPTE